jgi:hypothetical protein
MWLAFQSRRELSRAALGAMVASAHEELASRAIDAPSHKGYYTWNPALTGVNALRVATLHCTRNRTSYSGAVKAAVEKLLVEWLAVCGTGAGLVVAQPFTRCSS